MIIIIIIVAFRVSRTRRKMYIGHARLCVCLSVPRCMQSINQSIISLHSKVYEKRNRLTFYCANRGWRRRSGLLVKKLPNISNGSWATHLRRGRRPDIKWRHNKVTGGCVGKKSSENWTAISTAQYDTIHYIYVCPPKSWWTASLICRMQPIKKRVMKNLKTKKQDTQKKWSSHKVHGISPEDGRESMVGKICERGSSWAWSEKVLSRVHNGYVSEPPFSKERPLQSNMKSEMWWWEHYVRNSKEGI